MDDGSKASVDSKNDEQHKWTATVTLKKTSVILTNVSILWYIKELFRK